MGAWYWDKGDGEGGQGGGRRLGLVIGIIRKTGLGFGVARVCEEGDLRGERWEGGLTREVGKGTTGDELQVRTKFFGISLLDW